MGYADRQASGRYQALGWDAFIVDVGQHQMNGVLLFVRVCVCVCIMVDDVGDSGGVNEITLLG
jgi:hypothetical protein